MKIKKLNESSLVDKKVSTLGKAGKPMYFTAAQLEDAKTKYPEYDFEETTIEYSLPAGQKAYIAKEKSLQEGYYNCPECHNKTLGLANDVDDLYICDECGAEGRGYETFEGNIKFVVDDIDEDIEFPARMPKWKRESSLFRTEVLDQLKQIEGASLHSSGRTVSGVKLPNGLVVDVFARESKESPLAEVYISTYESGSYEPVAHIEMNDISDMSKIMSEIDGYSGTSSIDLTEKSDVRELPPSIEDFCMELAQAYGYFDYSDFCRYFTVDEIKKLKNLRARYVRACDYNDEEAENECDEIARETAEVIGRKSTEESLDESVKRDHSSYSVVNNKVVESKQVKTFGAKAKKLNEGSHYKVKFFQVFEAPKSPTDNGKMIGQRGTLDDANAFGKERVGEGNYIIKAVCDDGQTRNIDNDTDPSAYTLAEASYGGAYDIEDDQYFTRDDLNSFAEEVLGHVSETFDGKYDIGGVWFENGNVITQIIDADGGEYEDTTKVDMRKIREPWHLKKMYAFPVAAKIITQIKECTNEDPIDSLKEAMDGKYSNIFKEYADHLEYQSNFSALVYLVSQLIRYCPEDDLKDLWYEKISKSAKDNEFDADDLVDTNESLKEGIMEDATVVTRYLDVEIPELSSELLSLVASMRDTDLSMLAESCRKFYAVEEALATKYGSAVPERHAEERATEALEEDVEVPTLAGPMEGPESGLASLLNEALQDELKTIQMYNDIAIAAKAESFEDIASQIDEINTEENKHVGQLQELLKTISPNAQAMDAGELEAGDDLVVVNESADNELVQQLVDQYMQLWNPDSSDTIFDEINDVHGKEVAEAVVTKLMQEYKSWFDEDINNPEDSGNNNSEDKEGAAIMEGKERWEEVYDSFKTIEQELNGDGEAITSTIDKLYADNKDDPDYKKAYDKWANGE